MLTDQFQFQAEAIIRIGGKVYAVFFDTNEDGTGNFPILALVDSMNFVKDPNAIEDLDEASFAAKYGYVFRGHEDLLVSEIPTLTSGQEVADYRSVMDIQEAKLDKQGKEEGMSWLLDRDVQTVFLAAVLTGQPVSVDDLSETQWYNSSTPEQRNVMAEFYGDYEAYDKKVTDNISSIRNTLYQKEFTGDVNDLTKVLAYGVATNKYTPEQVDLYIDFIGDSTFLEVSGGEQMLPEELRPFVDQFETTLGQSTAKSYIETYVGPEGLAGFMEDGTLLRYASLIRDGQEQRVKDELQGLHDNMFPAFKGSTYSTWNTYYSNRASKIINGTTGNQIVGLTAKQKGIVNDLIIEAAGNYQDFDKLVRREYKDAPGVKNAILSGMLGRVPQAVSGVF